VTILPVLFWRVPQRIPVPRNRAAPKNERTARLTKKYYHIVGWDSEPEIASGIRRSPRLKPDKRAWSPGFIPSDACQSLRQGAEDPFPARGFRFLLAVRWRTLTAYLIIYHACGLGGCARSKD